MMGCCKRAEIKRRHNSNPNRQTVNYEGSFSDNLVSAIKRFRERATANSYFVAVRDRDSFLLCQSALCR